MILETITKEDLQVRLANHNLWFKNEPTGKKLVLVGYDLHGVNLHRANLLRANLQRTSLQRADLRDAYLLRANLRDASLLKADLRFANLRDASLLKADLRFANLRGANLRGAEIDYEIQEGLLKQIAEQVLSGPNSLNMGAWHNKCSTTHCLAGWACHLNPAAKALEKTHGTQIAGLLTLGAEAHSHFYDDNETAIEWLKTKV